MIGGIRSGSGRRRSGRCLRRRWLRARRAVASPEYLVASSSAAGSLLVLGLAAAVAPARPRSLTSFRDDKTFLRREQSWRWRRVAEVLRRESCAIAQNSASSG